MYKDTHLTAYFEQLEQKTVLSHRSFSAPLKISKTFTEPNQPALILYMMDASPGMMEGDHYTIELVAKQGSHCVVTNQASTKIHPAKLHGAQLNQIITVEQDAILEYFPEPTILYADSILNASTTIQLDEQATLIMAEVLACGRVERQERFQYRKASIKTKLYVHERLIGYEHHQFIPSNNQASLVGAFEHYTHQAIVWVVSPKLSQQFTSQLYESVSVINRARVLVGISQFEPKALAVRLLGFTAWELQQAISTVWSIARQQLLLLPSFSFRK